MRDRRRGREPVSMNVATYEHHDIRDDGGNALGRRDAVMPKYMRFPARSYTSYAGMPPPTTAIRQRKGRRLAGAEEDDDDSVDHMHPGSILMEGRSGTTIWMRPVAVTVAGYFMCARELA